MAHLPDLPNPSTLNVYTVLQLHHPHLHPQVDRLRLSMRLRKVRRLHHLRLLTHLLTVPLHLIRLHPRQKTRMIYNPQLLQLLVDPC